MSETTHDQRMAVRRDECRAHGHTFDAVLVTGSLAPARFVCGRCGSSWRIHPEDQGQNFGSDPKGITVTSSGTVTYAQVNGRTLQLPPMQGIDFRSDDRIGLDGDELVVTRGDGTEHRVKGTWDEPTA